MADDKWKVVGGSKKKIGNGQANHAPKPATVQAPAPVVVLKANGKVKRSKKVVMDYKIQSKSGGDVFEIPSKESANETSSGANKLKKIKTKTLAPLSKKASNLDAILQTIPVGELGNFFEELRLSGTDNDAHLSWIKYAAGALNTRLSKISATEVPNWPNDLHVPAIPKALQETIVYIISQTVNSVENDSTDILGLSFSSLLASIPNLCQRGDPGWGYLIFLREIIRIDPDVMLRRAKSYSDLMESYENKKEIGVACLWVSAQACLLSPFVLRIVLNQLLPYYNFKHYKNFIVSVLDTLAVADMAGDIVVETDEFEDFFEASFDPKKKRDFEKFYPRIKQLTLKTLSGRGSELFTNFLSRVGEKDFSPLSPYGHETFDILHGCLDNDPSVIAYWSEIVSRLPRESAALLNYLSKHVANVKCHKLLESQFIQTDEFAAAAVKAPELIRAAKKLQVGFQRIEASRRRLFSWKMATYLLLLSIIGLIWLDTAENGKGSFSKSNVGKFLESYGLLDEAVFVGEATTKLAKTGYSKVAPIFRNIYEGIYPVLQTIEKQVDIYIPEVVQFSSSISKQAVAYFNYVTEKVFVGSLSPENLRKLTKEVLTVIWSNLYFVMQKALEYSSLLVSAVKEFIQ